MILINNRNINQAVSSTLTVHTTINTSPIETIIRSVILSNKVYLPTSFNLSLIILGCKSVDRKFKLIAAGRTNEIIEHTSPPINDKNSVS